MCFHTRFIYRCAHEAGTTVKYCDFKMGAPNGALFQCPNSWQQPVQMKLWRCATCHETFTRDRNLWWQQTWWQLALDMNASATPGAMEHILQVKASSELRLTAAALELRDATLDPQDPRDYYRDLPSWMAQHIDTVREELQAATALLALSRLTL